MTTPSTPSTPIVVGVGAEGSGSALGFAVEEARRWSRPVHLVHVLQLPSSEAYAGLYGEALEGARATLARAVAEAERLAGDEVAVTSELVSMGRVVDELTKRTSDEELLVLEHRAFGRLHRLVGGSVVQSVAGRAHGPVVSVPEGWSPRAHPTAVVTAAVQDPIEAPMVLRAAFAEARKLGASLVVLHAWWLDSGFEAEVVDEAMRAEWADRWRTELHPLLAPFRSAFPDVEVAVDVRHAPPAEAVLDAAEVSDLLVIGRRHHLLPLRTHLGPVARAALAHATAPVLVTPESPVTAKEMRRERRVNRLLETLAPID
ncbi:universal stress protein [Nocardioides sp.]|uniref:universal stress protein n=1 Tax=Nocardioides sp. TaxID=35761 RepID=UPI001A266883|nr:universal stress protein [Nocardioides sp.]MBJ7356766.1 universal stress protein [Nocardioides sp.]